jgi:hypothetical protein
VRSLRILEPQARVPLVVQELKVKVKIVYGAASSIERPQNDVRVLIYL